MQQCTTCFKVNKDESLQTAIDAARKEAVEKGYPVAIVIEGGDYVFYNAFFAYGEHMNVVQVISNL